MPATKLLNNGVPIPVVGFGTYKIADDEAPAAVRTALEAGYRHVDTAALYRNERGVGQAVRESGLAREDVFVVTKLWNDQHGFDSALRAFDKSLARLGMDYVDLYLIHWPVPAKGLYVETWKAFERLYAEGRVRSIGVSNFEVDHLRRLLAEADVVPAVNQIELHPWLAQAELRRFHDEHGIATEAWSPLARGGDLLLGNDVVNAIAARLDATPAQVVMRWHVQLGNVVIPKSVTPARIKENFAFDGVELTDEDMSALAALDNDTRLGPHPNHLS